MRREYRAVVVFVGLLLASWGGWLVLFGDPPPDGVSIVHVEGSVQHITPTGVTAAAAGQGLAPRDRLVAGPDGSAVLALGEDARLTLDASSAVELIAVDNAGVRVELDGGRVRATVRPGGRRLEVAADGRSVSADDADFTVARSEDGTLAVASARGSVRTNLPGVASIGAGQKLVAPRDRQALVRPASEALLLAVVWPTETRTRADAVTVEGATEPGARVIFDGADGPVAVHGDGVGHFSATVALREGQNVLRAHATNALGEVAEVTWQVVRDTQAPAIQIELRP